MTEISKFSPARPRFPFLDYLNGIHVLREHKGWQIYRFKQAYQTSEGWVDFYVGHKQENGLIEELGLQAVLSAIDEVELGRQQRAPLMVR